MATNVSSSSGVVTIDLSGGHRLFRVDTAESISSWSVTSPGSYDGETFLIELVRTNAAHTVSFTGLATSWLGDVPAEPSVGATTVLALLCSDGNVLGDNPDPNTAEVDSVSTIAVPGGTITTASTIWEVELTASATLPSIPAIAERALVLRMKSTAGSAITVSLPNDVSMAQDSSWDTNFDPGESRELLVTSCPTFPGQELIGSARSLVAGGTVNQTGNPPTYTGSTAAFAYASQTFYVPANLVKEGTLLVLVCSCDGQAANDPTGWIDPSNAGWTTGGTFNPTSTSGSRWRWWHHVFTSGEAGSQYSDSAGTTAGAGYGSQSLIWLTYDGGSVAEPLSITQGDTGEDLTSPLSFAADSTTETDSVQLAFASTPSNTHNPGATPSSLVFVADTMPNWRGMMAYRSNIDTDGSFPAFDLNLDSTAELSGLTLLLEPYAA